MNKLLSVEEVAALLHVSRRTVRELARTARIPHRRGGGLRRCLFFAGELEQWLEGAALEVMDAPNGGRIVRAKSIRAHETHPQ